MSTQFLVVLRHVPYGRLDAAEAVRHLSGAAANGLTPSALLLDDGVYLAKAGQVVGPGWSDLAAALQQVLHGGEAGAEQWSHVAVYAHAQALQARGLAQADLVPGCQIADDATVAELVASADATLIY